MKRLNFFAMLMCSVAFMISSCGTSKVATNSASVEDNPFGKAVQQDICQTMQEEKPATRAVGKRWHRREHSLQLLLQLL